MIRHVVLFKLADNSTEACVKLQKLFLTMEAEISYLRNIKAEIDVLHSPRSYDISLQVVVDDMAALDAYQKNEYHVNVIKKYVHSVAVSSVAIDTEISEI